jgi:phosphopentomutase
MVKDNVIHGKIDIHKFTKLYESLNEKYGKEVIAEMMGMETTEIDKLVRYALETLPDQLKKKLQAAKGEIKTIEDLSTILNRLFNEYGDTLQHHFMIIDYGGKDSIWIQADNELWGMVQSMANYCEEQKIDINEYMKVALGQIKSNPALMDLAHSEKIVPPSENTPPPQETTPLPDTQSGNDEQTISQP